ncbi:MAG: hypothetical protein GF399_13050 [Candidatus Coatesbacteria bacterium]|nr:hypothetical protein [Candidatus Coatesbacteria bacterium]
MCPPNFKVQTIIINPNNKEVTITGLEEPTRQCFTAYRLSKPSGEAVALIIYDYVAITDKELMNKLLEDLRDFIKQKEDELEES